MQHYFGSVNSFGEVELDNDSLHHLLSVKRATIGEEIELSDINITYRCKLTSLKPLKADILEKVDCRENNYSLGLAFCLLKGDHNELIVLKGTELGVSRFYPVISDRVIVKPKGKEDNKYLRLCKIAKEGAEQCRRNVIPEVNEYIKFDDLLKIDYQHKIIPYEEERGSSSTLLSSLNSHKNESTLILIGPEGGFSKEEVNKAIEAGFEPVSLGKRILRAETAALYCCSLFSALDEE